MHLEKTASARFVVSNDDLDDIYKKPTMTANCSVNSVLFICAAFICRLWCCHTQRFSSVSGVDASGPGEGGREGREGGYECAVKINVKLLILFNRGGNHLHM